MRHIVITGGTRGIGFGMAGEFLKRGHMVTITGRTDASISEAIRSLRKLADPEKINGMACSAGSKRSTDALWAYAESLAPVDIWINNAGVNHETKPFHELDFKALENVIESNISGTVIATKVALKGMLEQGHGSIYNMEGLGSDGRIIAGESIYGMSKRAIQYFTKSLSREYKNEPILIGSISPGMVVTDMITHTFKDNPEDHAEALKIFHILSDKVDTVTPWIVERILSNTKNGAQFKWLTPRKILWRFTRSVFRQRNVEGLPPLR